MMFATVTEEQEYRRGLADVRAFISSHDWTFAKTMPDSPHWYVVKGKLSAIDQEMFERFVVFIRKYGAPKRFKNATYVHLDLDGYSYWTMGAPLNITIIINRHQLGFYDRIAEHYDELFDDEDSQQENENVFKMLEPALKPYGSTVLDIGSGTGLLLDLMSSNGRDGYGRRYLGIDPSHKMTARLKEKHPGTPVIEMTFEQVVTEDADGEFLRATETGFDLVAGLFGSMSYVDPRFLPAVKARCRSGHAFLMFYKPGYHPTTYEQADVEFSRFKTDEAALRELFPTVFRYNNFTIATTLK